MRSTPAPLLVVDACVLIDILSVDILPRLAELHFSPVTSDLVLEEISADQLSRLPAQAVSRKSLSKAQVRELVRLRAEYRTISEADLSAYILAKDFGGILLTGDRKLRKLAESVELQVHGTLWVLDTLVASRALSPQRAARSLTSMIESGSRLPRSECLRRLRAWGASGTTPF